ncbi:MAG: S8 family serine peptidase [Trueperaceae bacterium]|nr:S8 family serine peptidase [Trueperaceae bacterium]
MSFSYISRYKVFRRILFALTTLGIIVMTAACSTTPAPFQKEDFAYVGTVKIDSSESVASLEKMYGGKVILHKPEAGLAIMGFSQAEGELTTLTTEENVELASPEMHASGTSSWASGVSSWANGNSSWASGYASWANGWSTWSSGMGAPSLPDASKAVFDLVGVSQALEAANHYGAGVTVAVIDTGFDLSHPLLVNSLAPASTWKDFIDGDNLPQDTQSLSGNNKMYGHGTAVGGIIAQIAPQAKLMPIRVLNASGGGDLSDVVQAVDWAITHGANVINLSLGTDYDLNTLRTLIDYATTQQVHLVMATGNAGKHGVDFPAKYATTATNEDFVLSVGSIDSSKRRSSFSNYDLDVEFLAPGEGVVSAYPGAMLAAFSGTSFSTPIVSGLVALGLGESGIHEMETALETTSGAVVGGNSEDGFGIPNALQFLNALSN